MKREKTTAPVYSDTLKELHKAVAKAKNQYPAHKINQDIVIKKAVKTWVKEGMPLE